MENLPEILLLEWPRELQAELSKFLFWRVALAVPSGFLQSAGDIFKTCLHHLDVDRLLDLCKIRRW